MVTAMVKYAATAASAALPPDPRIAIPALEASESIVQTMADPKRRSGSSHGAGVFTGRACHAGRARVAS